MLLDLNLPHAAHARSGLGSGLTALRAARGDRTPVLVLSARDSTEERIAGLDAGADDYLGKPYELKEVARPCAPCCGAPAAPPTSSPWASWCWTARRAASAWPGQLLSCPHAGLTCRGS